MALLTEPAEQALAAALEIRRAGDSRGGWRAATTARRSPAIAALQPAVAKFFDDVLVMAEDERAAGRAPGAGRDAARI